MDVCITLDVGTTFMKVALFTMQGEQITQKSLPMVCEPANSRGEVVAPTEQWDLGMRELLKSCSLQEHTLQGIAISGHGPTLVPIYQDGTYAEAAIMWQDSSAKQYQHTPAHPKKKEVIPFIPARFTLPKIRKIEAEQPILFSKTKAFLGTSEFLSWLLTGEYSTILPSLGWKKYYWTEETLEACNLDTSKFPKFYFPGERIGSTTQERAVEYGLPVGVPVFAGGPDFMMALIGSGVTRNGMACNRSGTSEGVNLCTLEAQDTGVDHIFSMEHLIPGIYLTSVISSSSGRVVEWLWKTFGGNRTFNQFLDWALEGDPGAHGLAMVAHLEQGGYGERCGDAPGGFSQLNLNHTAQDMARAGLEGVLCEIREMVASVGCSIDGGGGVLRVAGGVNHPGYHQLKANILQCTIEILEIHATELMGNFICIQRGLGRIKTLQQGVDAFVRVAHTYTPNPEYRQPTYKQP